MECFIKKILENKIDEKVHGQFVRFGKGVYEKRAVVSMQKTSKVKVKGSFEYANDFVSLASEFGGGGVKEKNVVLSKKDISDIMSQNNIKGNSETKKGGLFYKNNLGEQNLNSEQIKILVENSYFALLDIEGNGFILKIKKNLPKPGKSGEGKVDDKFCVLEADLRFYDKIKEVFFWDVSDCKKAKAEHTYIINDLIMPGSEKDFAVIREMAKRKGKIKRKLEIDGRIVEKEREFGA